jgi:hypothetical protein
MIKKALKRAINLVITEAKGKTMELRPRNTSVLLALNLNNNMVTMHYRKVIRVSHQQT